MHGQHPLQKQTCRQTSAVGNAQNDEAFKKESDEKIMTKIHNLLALFFASLAVSTAGAQTVEFDRFKNVTTVHIPDVNSQMREIIAGNVMPSWHLSYEGTQASGKPKSAWLQLWSSSSRWRFLGCQEINFLINNKPHSVKLVRDSSVGRGSVTEILFVRLDAALLEEIVKASLVEYRVCGTEEIVPQGQIDALASVVRVPSPPANETKDGEEKRACVYRKNDSEHVDYVPISQKCPIQST